MKLPKYPLASSDSLMTFEFVSEGQKGFTNKLFKSLEEISLFIDNAAKEINRSIVKTTCAYKYIFFDPFWNEI